MAEKRERSLLTGILKRGATMAVFFVLMGAILFLVSGHPDWIWAWVFLGICVLSVVINAVIMPRSSLETVAERGQPKDMRDWDKLVSGLWGLLQYIVIPLIAALDVRLGWTHGVSTAWHLIGAVLLAAGLELTSWAMITNAFFSTAVRIQTERGHTVCRDGPYRIVRHPGYVGFALQSLGMPPLLGTWWALIPAIACLALMVIRTSLEDRTLQAELPGYLDYTRGVRYRLVPGIW